VAKKSKRPFCFSCLKNVLGEELFCLIVVKVVLGGAGLSRGTGFTIKKKFLYFLKILS